MQQIRGDVFSDATTDEFDGAVEGLAFAVIPHYMQITRAGGFFEVEAVMPLGVEDRIQLQFIVSDIASNAAIAAGVHHQPTQGTIRPQPQVGRVHVSLSSNWPASIQRTWPGPASPS